MSNPFGVAPDGGVPDAYNIGMLRNALARRVGQSVGSDCLDAEELDECLEASRRELNRMQPKTYLGNFQALNNVQRYAVGGVVPAQYLNRVKVFWAGGATGTCSNLGFFQSVGDIYTYILGNLMNLSGSFVDQSQIYMAMRRYAIVKRWFGGRGWLEKDGYIYLEPAPSADIVVYYSAEVPRFPTVLSIDEAYAEPFFDFAESKLCRLLAGKQSEVQQADTGNGKTVRTMGGRIYLEMAEKAERRFYDSMRSGAGAHRMFGV